MGRTKIIIPRATLNSLYVRRKFSLRKVADILGCTDGTVLRRLREYSLPTRGKTEMRIIHRKRPFSGDILNRAYLIGFRLGDLNVYKPSTNSRILIVRCHTTLRDQVALISSLFKKYGGITISHFPKSGFTINCYVDDSFLFLLEKQLPRWVFNDVLTAVSFVAGYIDAEGSFGLNQGKGRFKLDSYDYLVLRRINNFLQKAGIKTKFRLIARRGARRKEGYVWNNDLWRLNVNEAGSLERFTLMILPYLKHSVRRKGALMVLKNIHDRRMRGSI